MAAEVAGALRRRTYGDPRADRSCRNLDALRPAGRELVFHARRRASRSRSCLGLRAARRREDLTLVRGARLRRCAFLLGRRQRTGMARARRRRGLGRVMGLLPWRRIPPVLYGVRSAEREPVLVAEHAHRRLARTSPVRAQPTASSETNRSK